MEPPKFGEGGRTAMYRNVLCEKRISQTRHIGRIILISAHTINPCPALRCSAGGAILQRGI